MNACFWRSAAPADFTNIVFVFFLFSWCLQLRLMSECSGSIEDIKRVSLILDDEEQPGDLGLTGLTASDKQSGERRSRPNTIFINTAC